MFDPDAADAADLIVHAGAAGENGAAPPPVKRGLNAAADSQLVGAQH